MIVRQKHTSLLDPFVSYAKNFLLLSLLPHHNTLVFVTVNHFRPSLIFANKAGAYQSGEPLLGSSNGRAPLLPTNIRLRWK